MSDSNLTPFGSFGFKVNVSAGGGGCGCFQEVSGLSAQVNVTDLVEGGVNNTTYKLLGNANFSNVVLKRGLVDGALFDWMNQVIEGKIERQDIKIEILGDKREPVMSFILVNAVPIKWDGPSLNVMQDAIATESLEIAHEGLKRA